MKKWKNKEELGGWSFNEYVKKSNVIPFLDFALKETTSFIFLM